MEGRLNNNNPFVKIRGKNFFPSFWRGQKACTHLKSIVCFPPAELSEALGILPAVKEALARRFPRVEFESDY